MYAAKMDSEGAAMYDAAVALRDAMLALEVAVDGGKDSLSMAAGAGARPAARLQASLLHPCRSQRACCLRGGGQAFACGCLPGPPPAPSPLPASLLPPLTCVAASVSLFSSTMKRHVVSEKAKKPRGAGLAMSSGMYARR